MFHQIDSNPLRVHGTVEAVVGLALKVYYPVVNVVHISKINEGMKVKQNTQLEEEHHGDENTSIIPSARLDMNVPV